MVRFYFNIHGKDTIIPDHVGTEFKDLAGAHAYALKIIHETMFFVSSEPIWQGWMVKVLDQNRRHALTVLYPCWRWIDQPQGIQPVGRVRYGGVARRSA